MALKITENIEINLEVGSANNIDIININNDNADPHFIARNEDILQNNAIFEAVSSIVPTDYIERRNILVLNEGASINVNEINFIGECEIDLRPGASISLLGSVKESLDAAKESSDATNKLLGAIKEKLAANEDGKLSVINDPLHNSPCRQTYLEYNHDDETDPNGAGVLVMGDTSILVDSVF